MNNVEPDQASNPDVPEASLLDDNEVRLILRRALRLEKEKPIDVLKGVQNKIRKRSGGKFYADGWATGGSPPSTYIVTSVLMLVLAVLVFFVFAPTGWGR